MTCPDLLIKSQNLNHYIKYLIANHEDCVSSQLQYLLNYMYNMFNQYLHSL